MSDMARAVETAAELLERQLERTEVEYALVVGISRPNGELDGEADHVITGTSAVQVLLLIWSLIGAIQNDDRLTDRQKQACQSAHQALAEGVGLATTKLLQTVSEAGHGGQVQ